MTGAPGWVAAGASVRGSAHVRRHLPNQDALAIWAGSREPVMVAVSDGHGSHMCFRSDVGSRLAVDVGCRLVFERTADDGAGADLARAVVEAWRAAVSADLEVRPLSGDELSKLVATEGPAAAERVEAAPYIAYGSTLLLAAASRSRLTLLQLGDGDILAVDGDGAVRRPMPPDPRLIGNETTSLAGAEPWHDFRRRDLAAGAAGPVLLLLATDGYKNSFEADDGFLRIGPDYLELIRRQGLEVVREEMHEWLAEVSELGSGDDVTLGLLVRADVGASHPFGTG